MKNKTSSNTIVLNKKAKFEYILEDPIECGICLLGWEVKSLRAKRVQLSESHVIIRKGEAWLIGAIITPLATTSTHTAADPTRSRKLLLKKRELAKLIGQVERKGFTLVPISLYWKKSLCKLKIALGKGKKLHYKRQTIKDRDIKREQGRITKLN